MIKINCGFSRKVGEANYGSRGASVNLELELATDAARDGDGLQEKIRRLFALARRAVDEELNGAAGGGDAQPQPQSQTQATHDNGNGRGGPNGAAPATNKQTKLILDLARQQRMSLSGVEGLCGEVSGVGDVYRLTRSQASAVIDRLKASGSPKGGGGR